MSVVTQLKELATGRTFYVATTHLFWDPALERIKYYQLTLLLKTLKEAARPDEAIIVAGDTNSLPECNIIRLVKFGEAPTLERTKEP